MNTKRLWFLTLSIICSLYGMSRASANETVSIESLLREMTDREVLARFPNPTYTCKQFSSYDRASDDPSDDKTWYANADRTQFVRIEEKDDRKEYVMMDTEGPGAIVRVWGTWHGPRGEEFSDGTLRVYLDHQETPVYEGPITEFIDRGALAGAPLAQGVSEQTPYGQRGHNLYLPIPYAKHCKITYSTDVLMDIGAARGEALYYQINYRTYEPGAEVETFSMERLDAARATLEETQEELKSGIASAGDAQNQHSWSGQIAAGDSAAAIEIDEPGAIRKLSIKIDAKKLPQALRSTVLQMEFDGEETVWVPVGDFFGTGYKVRPYETWYTKVTEDGQMTCVWVMPFEKSAKLTLHNVGDQPVEVQTCEVGTSDWDWDDRSMHFHATWKLLSDIKTRTNMDAERGGRAYDTDYVTIDGTGVYVGDTLTLYNGADRWWGEGDEKIYVDGEDFPSHFGTGTEDYYGYAWCRPEFFCAPFHAQPEGDGNLTGGFSVNSRYRALDAIPFQKSLDFDMEIWHWAETTMDYAPATFFYARPGASTDVEPAPEDAALPVKVRSPRLPDTVQVEGALEAEELRVADITGGNTTRQASRTWGWSNGRQLWWTDGDVGDELELRFPAPKRGRYKVIANLTKASDYAKVKIAVNGKQVDQTFDRYHSSVETDKVELGTFDLKRRGNRLKFTITGANPDAIKRYMVGIDYLLLESAD